ncbi:MAG TPA: enolase C-terminal domain-like protein [Pirellulaceae bacterium]|nr:enolase C-terminal domain-like protein [Pirellulaceae bacterium]
MRIAVKETQLGLRNSTTRLPFRYGAACLTRCPQAVMCATVEVDGKISPGYAGDCLPPSWFDKSPDKDFETQVDDMLAVIALAEKTFADELATPAAFFPAWHSTLLQVHSRCAELGLTPLLASFGVSMVERAIMDAICRGFRVSFSTAVRTNLFGIAAGQVHASLDGLEPKDWLPSAPATSIYVRHTIGLSDPLTAAEIPDDQRLADGFPHSLEEYVRRRGLRFFKIKVANDLDHDLARLRQIAAIVQQQRGTEYGVTLDGNEQYRRAVEFDQLVDAIQAEPSLATFWKNVVAIEQPLERSIALEDEQTRGVLALSSAKPVIIDESDGTLESYPRAIEVGYRGVSSKNCKGPFKSLLNAGLTWLANGRGTRADYLMTGEDQCSVGVVAVQADLCLVATLGLTHVERNGHHYHPGLSYLPVDQQQSALAAHGDLYARQHGVIAPNIIDGKLAIGSIQCPGFGFAVEPDMASTESPDAWTFSSLGI